MRIAFERSERTLAELRSHGAEAEVSIHFYDDEDDDQPTLTVSPFVGVFLPVVLEGVRSCRAGSPVVFALKYGEFRAEPREDHLRVEIRGESVFDGHVETDRRTFAAELLSETSAFLAFLSEHDVEMSEAATDAIADQLRETRDWYERQFGDPG